MLNVYTHEHRKAKIYKFRLQGVKFVLIVPARSESVAESADLRELIAAGENNARCRTP
ncbi:MAG: hypothetical protein K0R61_5246 [Microvirga sp.]|nr:hypothetical protein [Microvirga sp.]